MPLQLSHHQYTYTQPPRERQLSCLAVGTLEEADIAGVVQRHQEVLVKGKVMVSIKEECAASCEITCSLDGKLQQSSKSSLGVATANST